MGNQMATRHHISINTSEYQFAHGHKPKGRGTWAFIFDNSDHANFLCNGTYTEALQQAVFTAIHSNVKSIKVGA